MSTFKLLFQNIPQLTCNPFALSQGTPMIDQYINSPYNFNTLSSRQLMRMKKIINWGILFGYKPNFQD